MLFSPWPESIFAFAPVWDGLVRQFEVLAIDLPGFGRSEGRDDLFTPQTMGDFIVKAIEAFGLTSIHAIGLDVGAPSLLFASLSRPELFRSLIVGAGAATYPLGVEGTLKWMIEADPLPPLNAREVVEGFLGSFHGYTAPRFVREDYLASYEGDRLTRSAALVRAYPKDLAALAPRLASIKVPVAIVVGRNDPTGSPGMRPFCANDCRMLAWTFWRRATASGKSARPSSSRSSRNGSAVAFSGSRSSG